MNPNTTCYKCNQPCYKRPSHLKLYKIHFCNRECQLKHQSEINPKTIINCSECNSQIKRTVNELRRSYNKIYFCNNKCKNIYLSKTNWKNNFNPTNHSHKRTLILNKFNNECVNCGYNKESKMLDIHHIDGNHQNNVDSNLITICVWCHQLYHRCKINLKFDK